jgi:hypothetical protein
MTEPRTGAGRELLAELSENPLAGARYAHHVVSLRLPAIEAEAEALTLGGFPTVIHTLDVEWLARAIHASTEHPNRPGCLDMDRDTAEIIAAEYAALERA